MPFPSLRRTFLAGFLAAVLGPPAVRAADPAWWTASGTRIIETTPFTPNDWAPVNAGQLKNVAVQARNYLNFALASYGGAGPQVTAMCQQFTQEDNYAPATVGQLKNVVGVFYDRLARVNFNWQAKAYGIASTPYPWTGTVNPENDAPANIGQLKNVFSFELNGTYFGNLSASAGNDDDGDGLTNLQEYAANTSPNDRDTDGDGAWDSEELENSTNPNSEESGGFPALTCVKLIGEMDGQFGSSPEWVNGRYTLRRHLKSWLPFPWLSDLDFGDVPNIVGHPPLDTLHIWITEKWNIDPTVDRDRSFPILMLPQIPSLTSPATISGINVLSSGDEERGWLEHWRFWARASKKPYPQNFLATFKVKRKRSYVNPSIPFSDVMIIDDRMIFTVPANANWSTTHYTIAPAMLTTASQVRNNIASSTGNGNEEIIVEEVSLLPVEVMQHPIAATSGTSDPPMANGPIRFCRWIDAYPGGVRDNQFADKDRDRFQIRIPAVIPGLTKIRIKATELNGAVVNGAFLSKTTDGDYEVDMKQVNGSMISEPLLLVSDGDDDVTFNGKGSADDGKNDQTLLADFGSKIIVTFPEFGNREATFQAQQPIATVTLDMVYFHPLVTGANPITIIPANMKILMERQAQKMQEIYRQIGMKVDGIATDKILDFPADWLVANNSVEPPEPINHLNEHESYNLFNRIKNNIENSNKIRIGFVNASMTDPEGFLASGMALSIGSDPCLVSLAGQDALRLNVLAHEAGHALGNRHYNRYNPHIDHWLMRRSAQSKWLNNSLAAKRWDDGDATHMKIFASPYYVPHP